MLRDLGEFGHQLAGSFAGIDGEPNIADAFAPLAALGAQRFQPPHPALVASTPRFDAAPNPHLFLGPELVELAAPHRFGRQLSRLLAFIGGIVARVAAQQAAIELENAGGDAIEEPAIVRDEYQGRCLEQ